MWRRRDRLDVDIKEEEDFYKSPAFKKRRRREKKGKISLGENGEKSILLPSLFKGRKTRGRGEKKELTALLFLFLLFPLFLFDFQSPG